MRPESQRFRLCEKMAGSCEVCSLEPSKYRCPTCAVMSCSLACTQSHKVYCAPKAASAHETPDVPATADTISPVQNGDHTQEVVDHEANQYQSFPGSIATSPELKELLLRHPQLRNQLHEIYRGTQEDQWVEWYTPPTRGRGHGRGGRAPTRRSRGPWTAEKGFNRGLGRVRKFRQDCEEGTETGPDAEAFMQFLALVNGQQEQSEQQHAT